VKENDEKKVKSKKKPYSLFNLSFQKEKLKIKLNKIHLKTKKN